MVKKCLCTNGYGNRGTDCPSHLNSDDQCKSCFGGYEMATHWWSGDSQGYCEQCGWMSTCLSSGNPYSNTIWNDTTNHYYEQYLTNQSNGSGSGSGSGGYSSGLSGSGGYSSINNNI